ncbi:MAG: S9 family peptidase, partial [Rhodospirillaceae bacterium]|nr:S9 family peptidase [Rhodospirillaceae bacterium]
MIKRIGIRMMPWLAGAALTVLAGCAAAQPANKSDSSGKLATFSDMESEDPAVQLDLLKHQMLQTEQKVIGLSFQLEHGRDAKMQMVRFPSGKQLIPGYVFTKPDMAPEARLPAVVLVHGGFHEHLDIEWFPLIVEMVKRGYVVMWPEYRGSQGYGETIYKNDYGTTDIADVLAASAYIAGKSFVDPARLAVVGESRGGMLTLLAIQQEPDRFKAAVDIVGLTDFVAYMAYKPEYRRQQIAKENPGFGGKLPDTNLAAYMKVSPINHVDKIKTPLLVLATTG